MQPSVEIANREGRQRYGLAEKADDRFSVAGSLLCGRTASANAANGQRAANGCSQYDGDDDDGPGATIHVNC